MYKVINKKTGYGYTSQLNIDVRLCIREKELKLIGECWFYIAPYDAICE